LSARAPRRILPILAALAGAVLVLLVAFHFVELRRDITDFLPVGQTDAARLMMRQLRSGAATSLILVGIEGAPPAELARISHALADTIEHSGQFSFVGNGEHAIDGPDERFLYAHRYLLSPVTTAAAFSASALSVDLKKLLELFESSAAPLAEKYGLADPPGAFLELAKIWIGGSQVRTMGGVWFAPDRDRALLVARIGAAGLDLTTQDAADAAIRVGFAAAHPGAVRLLVSGPAVFAREAAHGIRDDVRLLSIASTLLVAGLLFWRFRSGWVIAAVAVPIALSIAAAALAVQLVFGFVHGITLGFGMTMLGISVDYPVLLIGHRKQAEAASGTLRRIGFSFNMAVTTAVLGLTGMLFSGFPGISQLGLFSVVGLIVAAAATRFVMPRLIVAADLAPVWAGDPAALLRVEKLRDWRLLGAIPVAAAVVFLAVHPPTLERDLANLSPVPQQARDLDAELRKEIGAPDVGQVGVVRGDTEEDVLRREEQAIPAIEAMTRDGAVAGVEYAARFLPSAATQLARRAALPEPAVLSARMAEAETGLPFRPEAFAPFLADVGATREMSPVLLSDIKSPLIASRLQPLLFAQDGIHYGLIVPREVGDAARFAADIGKIDGALYIDIRNETNGIVASYTGQAWRWLALGGVAALVALVAGLRDAGQVARVVLALAAAAIVTVALLDAIGQRISLLHIVSLQLVAGVGLDYALFFARRQLDIEERARTLRTLVTCNAMTLLTFGLLALCETPLLREIGLTVAIGAVASMCFGFLFVGPAQPGTQRASTA
jgi:predicted exporter